jgi:hypothetical protein
MPSLTRRTVLSSALGLSLPWLTRHASACEFYTTSLTIIHPWTRATTAGATTAKVCMSFQDVTRDDFLIGAETPVAERVVLVDGSEGDAPTFRFAIHAGQTTVLTEAGVHLRLQGLKQPLQMGREYPLRLSFAIAGPTPAKLSVDYTRFL